MAAIGSVDFNCGFDLCFPRTYDPADGGRDGRQVMTGLTAATFPSLSNWEKVSKRLGCRLPVLMRGLHPDRQRVEGAAEHADHHGGHSDGRHPASFTTTAELHDIGPKPRNSRQRPQVNTSLPQPADRAQYSPESPVELTPAACPTPKPPVADRCQFDVTS
jgi:hypothetical protein